MTSHDSKYDLLQQEINMTSLTSELRRLQLAEMPKQQDQDTSDGLSPKVSGDHLISQTRSFLSLALEVREKIYELCFRDRLFTMHYRGTCKTRPDSQRAVFYEAHPFFIELGRFRPAKCLHPLMFKLNPTHKHKTPHISDWVLTRIRHFEIGRSRNFSFLDCIVASHRRVPVDHPVVVELVEMIFRKAPEKRLLESLCEKVRGTRIELLMPLADVGNPHSTYQMRYNAAEHRFRAIPLEPDVLVVTEVRTRLILSSRLKISVGACLDYEQSTRPEPSDSTSLFDPPIVATSLTTLHNHDSRCW